MTVVWVLISPSGLAHVELSRQRKLLQLLTAALDVVTVHRCQSI